MKKTLLILVLAFVAYFLFWPVAIDPQSWQAPKDAGYVGAFEPNAGLQQLSFIDLGDYEGPEDIAFDDNGFLYTGVAGGKILRINPVTQAIEIVHESDGRPLGLEYHDATTLLVADAYRGVRVIDLSTGQDRLISQTALGSDILYADDLDIQDGKLYISDASMKFGAAAVGSTMKASVLEIFEHGRTGRVLVMDVAGADIDVISDNWSFANGIAASGEDFILVVETGEYRIMKVYVAGPKQGQREVFIDNLPGYPDNINRDSAGGYFVGLVNPRSSLADGLADKPFMRKMLMRIPGMDKLAVPKPYGFLLRLDEQGNVVQTWQDPEGGYHNVTGAVRGPDGKIYVSSLSEKAIAVISQ